MMIFPFSNFPFNWWYNRMQQSASPTRRANVTPFAVLARWESQRGKHWVEAVQEEDGTFGFRADGAAGHNYATADAAMARAEQETRVYTVTMRRVK